MLHERFDGLSILSIESDKADEINLSEVARQFANAKVRSFIFCIVTMQHISQCLFRFFINKLFYTLFHFMAI